MGSILLDERVVSRSRELTARVEERRADRDDQRCLRHEQLADRQHGTLRGKWSRFQSRTLAFSISGWVGGRGRCWLPTFWDGCKKRQWGRGPPSVPMLAIDLSLRGSVVG